MKPTITPAMITAALLVLPVRLADSQERIVGSQQARTPQLVQAQKPGPKPVITGITPAGRGGQPYLRPGVSFVVNGHGFTPGRTLIGIRTSVRGHPAIPPPQDEYVTSFKPSEVTPNRLEATAPPIAQGSYLLWVYVEGAGHSEPVPIEYSREPLQYDPPTDVGSNPADPKWADHAQLCSASAIDAIDQKWQQHALVLGAPTGGHRLLAPEPGCTRPYANGVVVWNPCHGAYEVHGSILARWLGLDGPSGVLGYPVSDELTVPYDIAGRYSDFQNGSIFWRAETGAHEVHGAILARWLDLGGAHGTLGYPISDERTAADNVGRYNDFQNGSIYWRPSHGTVFVPKAIKAAWMIAGGVNGEHGYPIAEPIATPEGGIYQRFESSGLYRGPKPGARSTMEMCQTKNAPRYGFSGSSASGSEAQYADAINGIAHSSDAWFLAHNDESPHVWRLPISYDFEGDPGRSCEFNRSCWAKYYVKIKSMSELVAEGFPGGYNHFGDPDFYARPMQWLTGSPETSVLEKLYPMSGGRLFVPVEGKNKPPVLAALDDQLGLRGHVALPQQTAAGWVAVNPTNGLIYMSNDNPTALFVYEPVFVDGDLVDLKLVSISQLSGSTYSGKWVQGGAFSDSGKFYLTYHRGWNDGVLDIFETDRTGVGVFFRLDRIPLTFNGYWGEIQGLTVVDRPSGAHPSIQGQVHVAYLDMDPGDDDWFLMHLELLPNSRSACF